MKVERFKIGDKVVKNKKNWIINDFDSWGRGEGIGEVVDLHDDDDYADDNYVDVKWPGGRCYESISQIKKIDVCQTY